MRHLILTAAIALAGGSATAASIEPIKGNHTGHSSMIVKTCGDCPVLKPKEDVVTYTVPSLPEGTQKTEIREINGEKKLVRTEAWLGGSPVVFVSKLPASMATKAPTAAAINDEHIEPIAAAPDGIDMSATTAAVGEPAPKPLDVSTFELRP
jgi:hypothetical protein